MSKDSPASSQPKAETLAKVKLDRSKMLLLRDYDDSSDEEDSLDYQKIPVARILECTRNLFDFAMLHYDEMKELRENLEDESDNSRLNELVENEKGLISELDKARDEQNATFTSIMEIEGRKAIYRHLSKYRERKLKVFGETTIDIKEATYYDAQLLNSLIKNKIITEAQALKWKNQQDTVKSLYEVLPPDEASLILEMGDLNLKQSFCFSEENKFDLLRSFLRQTHKEFMVSNVEETITTFVHSITAVSPKLNLNQIKLIAKDFIALLPKVQKKHLKRTYVNPDITSVEEFYAEEMLRYRALTRKSRDIEESGFEVTQGIVFDADADLVSQKKQIVSKDKRLDSSKDRFSHRGTVEEEVLNLGNYRNVLRKLKTLGSTDQNIAKLLRIVFVKGAKVAFDTCTTKDGNIKLSEFLSSEKKQIIIDTVELLFGTEGFRSPSTIIETNMLLDLIIYYPNEWSFERAFVGKFIKRSSTVEKLIKRSSPDKDKLKELEPNLVAEKTGDIANKNDIEIGELFDPETGRLFTDWQERFDLDQDLILVSINGEKRYFTGSITPKSLGNLKAVSDIANGGALSYTMKSVSGHKGGIACGRRLSKVIDDSMQNSTMRPHKYGGSFQVSQPDFNEYKSRKEAIAKSWVERCTSVYTDDLEAKIRMKQTEWYGR